ncbi:MAG TPA: ABC transporter substrate-binding protein [Kofleriaceae bacterium]|nr:ABC transporter substrate-binding protein [Kofleriaceae bacterium]
MPSRPLAALVVMATVAATSACAVPERRTPDDTLVVLIPRPVLDLDPRFAINSYDTKLSRLIAPGLTTVDTASLEPAPALAESITQIDDLTWEVTLKDGVKFSNGLPVLADDVVYTYSSVLDPATKSLFRSNFADRFKGVEKVSARVVRFHLQKPIAMLMSDFDFGIVSAVAARAGGGRFAHGVVGAGPYRVVRFASERILLSRNPYYAGPVPPMAKILVRTVRDPNARTLMLVGGSADLTQNGIRLDLASEIEARPRVKIETAPSAILTYLMMQTSDPLLGDVRVRRAIAHAIDRKTIIDAKLGHRAVLATGLLAPGHWAYRGDVKTYAFDPVRARALLTEAGFPDPDGPGGKPRMHLVYKTSSDPYRLAIARVIAAQLAEVGIDAEVRAFEFGTFLADIKRGNYQLASMQTASIGEPDYYFAYFHSSRIPTAEHPATLNRWRYANPKLDALLEAGRRTVGKTARIAIYGQVQAILANDVPIIPMWHEHNIAVMNVDVSHYKMLPNARFSGLAQATKAR